MLRRTNYGEADRILNLLTPEHGKVSAIAKGVRRARSKLAGGLELFATCDITVMRGRGEMGTISSARLVKFYGDILKDYDRMQLGYELVKLINRAAETVPDAQLYYLLRDGLAYLNEQTVDTNIVEIWFRLRLADYMGVGLNLATSTDGEALRVDAKYDFDFAEMSFVPRMSTSLALPPSGTRRPSGGSANLVTSGRFGSEHIKLLRLANAKNPAVLRQVGGLADVLADCLWLVRSTG